MKDEQLAKFKEKLVDRGIQLLVAIDKVHTERTACYGSVFQNT
jgi:hypothetical protein